MRACWLKWVGRDWSISADYIWLNYSDANIIAISVAVFAFSALFLKVERCQKDSGGDYSHLWFVSGLVLNVDSSGDFTMSVESEDPYNDGSDRLTILVDSEHTRYVSDSPVSVGSKVKVGYFLDSRKKNTIRCSSVDVLE